jgi:cytochrome c peroxidase
MDRKLACSAVLFVSCAAGWMIAAYAAEPAKAGVDPAKLTVFRPLPGLMVSEKNPITEAKVQLGRMLFYEPRLSRNQEISCNTCHDLKTFGVDAEPVSTGHKGLKGNRNAPTVYNAAGHFVQFWDGRAPDVEEQAKGPVMNPVEMAMPGEKVAIAVLKSMPEYLALFRKAFPGEADPVTFDNMAKAIGAFERKLVTPGRWDKFLKGDRTVLTPAEQAGLNKFLETGCQGCHQGAYLGGSMYQKLGLAKPWRSFKDLGRFEVTKKDGDKLFFKVPSLRNIANTKPYFHDGSVPDLEQAVALMAEHENGKKLSPQDIESIVTWLKALTGEIPADYIRKPELPKSTDKTPRPDRG